MSSAFANNKEADQPVRPGSLTRAFVIGLLERIISKLTLSQPILIDRFCLVESHLIMLHILQSNQKNSLNEQNAPNAQICSSHLLVTHRRIVQAEPTILHTKPVSPQCQINLPLNHCNLRWFRYMGCLQSELPRPIPPNSVNQTTDVHRGSE